MFDVNICGALSISEPKQTVGARPWPWIIIITYSVVDFTIGHRCTLSFEFSSRQVVPPFVVAFRFFCG